MSARQDVFLLDIDSVLLQPLGYHEALRDTLNHFGLRMNQAQGALSPTYEEIDVFETVGFSSEWDSIPMCLAAFLAEASAWGRSVWRETLTATLTFVARSQVQFPRPDYAKVAQEIAAALPDADTLISHRALAYFEARTPPEAAPVLNELFEETAHIHTATTRAFQHYTLGSDAFVKTYGFGPDFTVESYLLSRDVPLLNATARAQLLDSRVPFTLDTARPSHPPQTMDPRGYAPEAEIARTLVGLEEAPLIGFGHVSWLASSVGEYPNAFTKPSPVQALAAIGLACADGAPAADEGALWGAFELVDRGRLGAGLARLRGQKLRVTVFEDTPGGIMAVRRAGELLDAAGVDVAVRGVGVAASAAKRSALEAVADVVVEDINAALARAEKNINHE